ncbi:MAG: N-acetylmuramoyl-L-alanine amidase [Thermocrispum sp.]
MRRLLGVLCLVGLGACGGPSGGPDPRSATASDPAGVLHTTPTSLLPTTTTSQPPREAVVVLDPGHNGGNAAAPGEINQQVPAGRGRTKACNTTGTASEDGYPEHAFTFDVARRVRELLETRGVTVTLTRTSDVGVGPCVNRRAAIGNKADADAVVSIHADGNTDQAAEGFHVAYSAPPLNDAQGEPSTRLARAMRDGLRDAGRPVSSYLGSDGLAPRDDLAGLNLSERPAVLVECGNMRHPREAAAMATAGGRQEYADAIAAGVLSYLRAG